MDNESPFPQRKHPRLKTFDYSRNGVYFVTVCSKEKKKIFSEVYTDQNGEAKTRLTAAGRIVEDQLKNVSTRFPGIETTDYIIMPNHVHALFLVYQRPVIVDMDEYGEKPTLCDVVCAFKSLVSIRCGKELGIYDIFQTSFYEHVVRKNDVLGKIKDYIRTNPARWRKDRFYIE